MKSFETYVERGAGIDPYASFAETPARIRFQAGRRSLFGYNLKISPATEARVRLTARFPQGSLSLATMISNARADRPVGLPDLLRTLEAVRVKADPYVEIGEQLVVIAEILRRRTGIVLEKPAAQVHVKNAAAQKPSLDEFLRPVLQLGKSGHVDAALDVLYDRVDDLLKAKEFSTMDVFLRQANIDSLSVDILLGLLTASLPAKSKLPSRSRFYAEVESSIKRRGEWENGLLTGLES